MPTKKVSRSEENGTTGFTVRFKAGKAIFSEGDAGDVMFIIKAGEVEIHKRVGGKDRRIALLEEGDFFGEMAILENEPRMASARAVTMCELLRIDSSTFDQMVRHNPEIPIRMLRKFSHRLREYAAGAVCVDEGPQVTKPPKTSPPPPPPNKPAAKSVARIVHPATGTEFELPAVDEVFVGRVDAATGFEPQIVLKDIDPRRTTSRRHARIMRKGDVLFLREEIGVNNGTFVNGKRVTTGVDVELHDGDEIRFGVVKTVLHLS